MAAYRKQGRMLQEEFNVAMKLVALCQSNYSNNNRWVFIKC